ncbi:MAG: glycosyltransferase family 4 protein [Cyclobacteriaceae bacterium]
MQDIETAPVYRQDSAYNKLDILIVGNPDSLFAYQLAESWERLGAKVRILTVQKFFQGTQAANGIDVLKAEDFVDKSHRDKWKKYSKRLRKIERLSFRWDGKKYKEARKNYVFESGMPSVEAPYLNGKLLGAALEKLRPDFVFVQESYTFGGLSLFYSKTPVVLFPFGGDIYTHSQVSLVSHLYMKRVLKSASLVMPTASSSVSYLHKTFGVPEKKVQPVSWGVDRSVFVPMNGTDKQQALRKWNVPAGRKVILNIRRFRPGWGALVALETFIQMAETYPGEYYFVLLGGAGKDKKVLDEAAVRLRNEGLTDRILLIEDRISLEDVAELMGISDAFVNLMTKEDMRSFSIIQGAARGSVPVLIDQPEYRHMEKDGFQAVFVPKLDPQLIATKLHHLCSDEKNMQEITAANLEYIREKEDGIVQVKRMLDIILAHMKRQGSENNA